MRTLTGTTAVEPASHYKLPKPTISPDFPFESRFISVSGSNIHYVEQGTGDPVLLVHASPTSSYLWRNVIPYVSDNKRAVALDLIGMGKSDKPDISYTFGDHYDYMEGFIDRLQLKNITLVLHDWGAALGFEYARRHPENVNGIVFMEGLLPPAFPQPSFEAMGEALGAMFKSFKDLVEGPELIIKQNIFIEKTLPTMSTAA
ncbi:MAG: alpha/beta fold hydrolase [Motiliproteus sp.]